MNDIQIFNGDFASDFLAKNKCSCLGRWDICFRSL